MNRRSWTKRSTPESILRQRVGISRWTAAKKWLGKALKGKRDKVIVMTKVCTHGRDKDVAMQQLEDSLRRLQTDHLDVWQIHEVIYWNDPDMIFAPDGAIEALVKAKKQGKVRFVGFTGHKDPRDSPEDALARFSVRHRADAAELLRRDIPQFRTARSSGVEQAGHRTARHEKLRRKRRDVAGMAR